MNKFPSKFHQWYSMVGFLYWGIGEFCVLFCFQYNVEIIYLLIRIVESILLWNSCFCSKSKIRRFSSQILTNVSCSNHVITMEHVLTLSTVTIVIVLQASTEPTVPSVSRHRFEFCQRLSMWLCGKGQCRQWWKQSVVVIS